MEYVYLQPDGEIEIGGETNDAELFENDWCPLFGSPPDLKNIMTSDDPLSRSESVILDARELLFTEMVQGMIRFYRQNQKIAIMMKIIPMMFQSRRST